MVSEPAVIDGVFNLRDLGGFVGDGGAVTRSGLIFRSDGLHRATVEGRQQIRERGIAHVIDLRTDGELNGDGRFEHPEITFERVPIIENLADLAGSVDPNIDVLRHHYAKMTTDNGRAFATALAVIAASVEAGQPVAYHCTAGKDRTGVLSALLLAGLGVADDEIAGDYARSAEAMAALVDWYRRHERRTPPERMKEMGLDPSLAERMIGAEVATMLGLLEDLRATHGDVSTYLDHIGAAGAVERIGRRLLVDTPT